MVTKLLTTINDREILDGQIDTFVDVSGAADRYLVEGTISGDVEVQDFDGGVIVLPATTPSLHPSCRTSWAP